MAQAGEPAIILLFYTTTVWNLNIMGLAIVSESMLHYTMTHVFTPRAITGIESLTNHIMNRFCKCNMYTQIKQDILAMCWLIWTIGKFTKSTSIKCHIPVPAWHDGKVEHIMESTMKAIAMEHMTVGHPPLFLASAMRTKRLVFFCFSFFLMFPCDHFLYIESHNNILDSDLTLMHFHYQYCCQILPIQDKFCSLFYMDQWHLFHMYSHGDATIYDESQSNIRQWS